MSTDLAIRIGPRTARMQTVMIHGPEHLNRQVRGLGRDVPSAVHMGSALAYESVEAARAGFASHTDVALLDRSQVPDLSTPYVRLGHPNGAELENKLLFAHGLTEKDGYGAMCFATGMAAVFMALMVATRPGDEIIMDNDLYGCTARFAKIAEKMFGRKIIVLDLQDTDDGYVRLKAAITPRTRAIYSEVETNPHLKLVNVAKIARLAHEVNVSEGRDALNKIRVIFDNTFLGPLFCRPWELIKEAVPDDPEIAIVVESLTKIISGFGLEMGGVVIAPNNLIHDINWADVGLIAQRDFVGGVLTPHAAFDISNRSLPTYITRAKYAEQNAMGYARYLETLQGRFVSSVTYPGLDSYPQTDLARTMIKDYDGNSASGYMIGFNFFGDPAMQERAATRYMNHLAQNGYAWTFMVSLGQVRSLVEVPAAMTHYGTGMPMFARVSVGTESLADLIAESNEAFKAAYAS